MESLAITHLASGTGVAAIVLTTALASAEIVAWSLAHFAVHRTDFIASVVIVDGSVVVH